MPEQIPQSVMEARHNQMLYPTCRVRSGDVGGSATIVYSQEHDGDWYTFALTNYHVIENAIEIDKEWDPDLGKEVQREIRSTVEVQRFRYNNFSNQVGGTSIDADIRAYNNRADIALLELRDKENAVDNVATILPKDRMNDIHLFETVFAVGAALGHEPITTKGMINCIDDEIDNYPYMLSTANSIFGNSGGALFWVDTDADDGKPQYLMVGIPSRIAISIFGFSPDAITHMGWSIWIETIHNFLKEECYDFITGIRSKKDADEARKKKREEKRKERLIVLQQEG